MRDELDPGMATAQFERFTHPVLRKAVEGGTCFISAFVFWADEPGAPFPIGEVPLEVAAHLGSTTQTVLLSADTYAKQVDHHPEITPPFYAILPVIFQEGEAYEYMGTKIQFVWEAGVSGFEVTVKVTAVGELFLVSFFRAKRSRIEKARRKYRRVHGLWELARDRPVPWMALRVSPCYGRRCLPCPSSTTTMQPL
jgi:hypothetical protein